MRREISGELAWTYPQIISLHPRPWAKWNFRFSRRLYVPRMASNRVHVRGGDGSRRLVSRRRRARPRSAGHPRSTPVYRQEKKAFFVGLHA